MFGSIKPWLNIPVTIKPFTNFDGTGKKVFGTDVEALCYVATKVQVINDHKGVETVSNTQLFVDGTTIINALDSVLFDGQEHNVKNVSGYYMHGVMDIRVVYI